MPKVVFGLLGLLALAMLPLGEVRAQQVLPSNQVASAPQESAETRREVREGKDLVAQQEMAVAADRLVFATWWQIVIGVVSMIGLLWTLGVTRSAARMQLRAYLIVEMVRAQPIAAASHFLSVISVKNVGQTPAYGISCAYKVCVKSVSEIDEYIRAGFDDELDESLTLGPNHSHTVNIESDTNITAGDATDILSEHKVVVVIGVVRYSDVFKRRRTTRFAHIYGGTDLTKPRMGYHPLGNLAD